MRTWKARLLEGIKPDNSPLMPAKKEQAINKKQNSLESILQKIGEKQKEEKMMLECLEAMASPTEISEIEGGPSDK